MALPEAMRETVVEETAALLAPALRDEEGNWTADYVRLRLHREGVICRFSTLSPKKTKRRFLDAAALRFR